MVEQPNINDVLFLIRPKLEEEAERLNREIRAVENKAAARGRSGHMIQEILDLSKHALGRGIVRAFGEASRVSSIGPLDAREVRDVTVQELENFRLRVQGVADPKRLKRHFRTAGIDQIVDHAVAAWADQLRTAIRQFDTGLLDLGAGPPNASRSADTPTVGGPYIDGTPQEQPIGEGVFSGAGGFQANAFSKSAFQTAPAPLASDANGNILGVKAVGGVGGSETQPGVSELFALAAVDTSSSPILTDEAPIFLDSPPSAASWRGHLEQAGRLTRALSRSVNEEIVRLKEQRRNDPDADTAIDFLTVVSAILDRIADCIDQAQTAANEGARAEKLEEVEPLAKSLANAAREYCKRNCARVTDFGGNTVFVALGAAAFTQMLGVSPDAAFAGALGLLAIKK